MIITSCSLSSQNDQNDTPIDPIAETRSETLFQDGTSWVGSGKILLQSQLRSLRDSFHILLQGQLFAEDSFIIVHLFFDNFDYDTGIQLLIRKVESTENTDHASDLQLEFAEPGLSFQPLAEIKQALNNEGQFRIRIEAINRLNNEKRLLVWNDQLLINSQLRHVRDKIIEGNADYDSLDQNKVFYRWGAGISWGVTLENVRINLLKREAPFVDL